MSVTTGLPVPGMPKKADDKSLIEVGLLFIYSPAILRKTVLTLTHTICILSQIWAMKSVEDTLSRSKTKYPFLHLYYKGGSNSNVIIRSNNKD